jgi:predicted DNA-binding transcriptional regulator AlpA
MTATETKALPPIRLSELDPDEVLTRQEFCRVARISIDTLERMEAANKAPPRTQLSDRRFGFRVGAVRQWLAARTEGVAA